MDYRTCFWRNFMVAGVALVHLLTGLGHAQEPAPAAPTDQTEVRDLSKPPLRTLRANIRLSDRSWNVERQEAVGPAVVVSFDAGAAPLERVGKTVPTGAIEMTPEVAGEWKWERADRLIFFPAAAWLPPGSIASRSGRDCWRRIARLAEKTDFDRALRSRPR